MDRGWRDRFWGRWWGAAEASDYTSSESIFINALAVPTSVDLASGVLGGDLYRERSGFKRAQETAQLGKKDGFEGREPQAGNSGHLAQEIDGSESVMSQPLPEFDANKPSIQ
jgi:hypothetical protein